MTKQPFQDILRDKYKQQGIKVPTKVSTEKFLQFMKGLSDQRAAEFYSIYRNASIRGQVKRCYKTEYRLFHSRSDEKKNRKSRDALRNKYIRDKRVKRNDGTVLHHKDHNALNNSERNIEIRSGDSHRCLHQPEAASCDNLNPDHSHSLRSQDPLAWSSDDDDDSFCVIL